MIVECKQCGKSFDKRPSQIRRTKGNNFCGRSCACSYNNAAFPKRGIDKSTTLGDFKKQFPKLWRLKIAQMARYDYYTRHDGKTICKNCSYNKHVDVCHIKEVKDFTNESALEEINHKNNMVGLCKNCHWELDNGMLILV